MSDPESLKTTLGTSESAEPPKLPPRRWCCTDCVRDSERAEQAGRGQQEVREPRSYRPAGAPNYHGALCTYHAALENCRRYQRARASVMASYDGSEQYERMNRNSQKHDLALQRIGHACLCDRALEHARRAKEHDEKPLHPCVGGCTRQLVPGVGRCHSCTARLQSKQLGAG